MMEAFRVNRHLPLAQPKDEKAGTNLFPQLPTVSELRWNLWEVSMWKFMTMWELRGNLWELISSQETGARCAQSLLNYAPSVPEASASH